jgi:hypothetical protein
MSAKNILVGLVENAKKLNPDISIEFTSGSILLKGGKHVYRERYTGLVEEEASKRMLETIFLNGVFGHPEIKK